MPPSMPVPFAREMYPVIAPLSVLSVVAAEIVVVPRSGSASLGSTPLDGLGAMQCASLSGEQLSGHVTIGPVHVVNRSFWQAGVQVVNVSEALMVWPRLGTAVTVP